MTKFITYHPFQKICVLFHIKVFLLIFFSCAISFLSVSAFAAEPADCKDTDPSSNKEAVYIIPEQLGSALKLGVAVTPDQCARYANLYPFPFYQTPFDDDYNEMRNADVSTVVRIALNEFKVFSGLNQWIQNMEKTVHGYSRKFKLTGELKVNEYNSDPIDYIEKVNLVAELYRAKENPLSDRQKVKTIRDQFEINKLTWDMGFHVNSPQLSFKLEIGDAMMIQSSIGDDIKIGAMIKISL